MRPFLQSPSQRVATAVSFAALAAIGFVPLFGGPGYEAAVAAGLVIPVLAALATALDVVAGEAPPFAAFRRGVASGAWLGVVGLVTIVAHGMRVGFCDAAEGTELYALGPGAGAVMGGVWGAVAGSVAARRASARRLAILYALAGPLVGIGASVLRFYTSPMVFAFDPFFGFFAGTLYDSVITGLGRLVTYRLGSLATLVAVGSAAAVAELARAERGFAAARRYPGVAWLSLVAAVASVVHAAAGPSLGHYQTTRTIREALGQRLDEGRCEVVYPTGTPDVEAHALLRECNGHLAQLGAFFGVPGPEHVTAFVFASADQKGSLMGAAGTYIAKPWRREIYVQRAGFPHPVMRHELAHVVAGTFAGGPFRVAGPVFGLVPDPGRIEGVAVAAAPHDEQLSLGEWARAMRDLSLLPPLARVFKLSFLGEPSSRAYVVAGAFIDWLRHEHGIEAVRAWYGGASLVAATGGRGLAELEKAWLASLDGLRVGDDVLHVARARFDQPAIFGRRCPHVVDRIAGEAGAALGQLDTVRARRLYAELLELDPHDLGARLGLATCALREGKSDRARAEYEKIAADEALGRTMRARAVEALGDLALARGDGSEARRRFDEVATVVVDADRLRTLDVKRYAIDGPGRDAILAHLIGDPELGRDAALAAASLGAWAAREPPLGMADYLLARTYLGDGRWQLAADSLDRALERQLTIPSVLREANKLRMIVACALGDRERAASAYAAWLGMPGPRAAERSEMAELHTRCTGTATPPAAVPELPGAAGSSGPRPASGAAPGPGLPGGAGSSGPRPASPAPPAAPASAAAPAPPEAPSSALGAATRPGATGCPDGMERLPEAETWIGSPRGQGADDEWPRYRTRIAAFCMDRTEVTVGAYASCVGRGACTPPDANRVTCTASAGHGPDFPINCVDAMQAAAFCASRSARLPTEAEWEYAASGGDDRLYSWGSEAPDDRTCWRSNGACRVGSLPAGAFGLFDMTGNVWEWTSDGYGDYPWPPVQSAAQVYRGGSWSRRFEKWMRVRLRNRGPAELRGSHLGFRCASTLPDAPCPFGRDDGGRCLAGVLEADCREGKTWNGVRCAKPGESRCGEGHRELPGHGCVWAEAVPEAHAGPLDLAAVRRERSPEFDPDCQKFQPTRPSAYRFSEGTHEARNAVERAAGCKNRDVGVGWNSACCP